MSELNVALAWVFAALLAFFILSVIMDNFEEKE